MYGAGFRNAGDFEYDVQFSFDKGDGIRCNCHAPGTGSIIDDVGIFRELQPVFHSASLQTGLAGFCGIDIGNAYNLKSRRHKSLG